LDFIAISSLVAYADAGAHAARSKSAALFVQKTNPLEQVEGKSKSINPKLVLTVSHSLLDDIDFGTATAQNAAPAWGRLRPLRLLCQTIYTTKPR
jgi:hypothetical protein